MDLNVKRTLLARVYDVADETPLTPATKLSGQKQTTVLLKREDLQPVHSFKLRGAYNKIYQLSKTEKSKGVIAASAGNHAQGVALAAKKLGISAVIVMPKTTPSIKVEAVKSYGAKVILVGDNFSDAYEHSLEVVEQTGRIYIHPFDDPLVIAGQGTVGREILEQEPDVTHIFVPIGGGGLIAGISQYVKQINKDVKIIGVEPDDSNVMQASLKANKRVTLKTVGIFADGVAVKQAGKHTYDVCRKYVDKVITVSTDQICAGIKAVFEDTRAIVEPAGALAAAGIMRTDFKPKDVVVGVCSGANVSFERLQQIAERTMLGSGQEAIFAVNLPEQPGALAKFCQRVINGHGITSFSYRLDSRHGANILISIHFSGKEDIDNFKTKMKSENFNYQEFSSDDIAKDHIRHMIGGSAKNASSEHFYRVVFPERPNALRDFLSTLSQAWNISAFNYRSQASDKGYVLIAFEAKDRPKLEQKLNETGYSWENVDNNSSIKTFIADH